MQNYHGNKAEVLSEYNGSEKPIDIVYHCELHGDTYTTINAKNICKSYFLSRKECQSIRKSESARNRNMQCNIQIQYSFDDLVGENNEKSKYDFAIFDNKNKLIYLVEIDDKEYKDRHLGDSPRQIQRQKANKRDKTKNTYCKDHNINLYRMEVPFRGFKKWNYVDYYRYINAELKYC